MLRYLFIMLFIIPGLMASGQAAGKGKRLKDITFRLGSTEFANANQDYNTRTRQYRNLADSIIVLQLVNIMHKNTGLVVEVAGHCDAREDPAIAVQRANLVTDMLVKRGIDRRRLVPKAYGHTQPLASDSLLALLDTEEELAAGHQKNRRVSIHILRIDFDPNE